MLFAMRGDGARADAYVRRIQDDDLRFEFCHNDLISSLKTKGYNFEHNDSHGKQQLSSLPASLMLLAFLTHSVLDLLD